MIRRHPWVLIGCSVVALGLVAVISVVAVLQSCLHRGERAWNDAVATCARQGVALDTEQAFSAACNSTDLVHPDWLAVHHAWRQWRDSPSYQPMPDWCAPRRTQRHGAWSPLSTEALDWLATVRPIVDDACRYLDTHSQPLTALERFRAQRPGKPVDIESWFSRRTDAGELAAALMALAQSQEDPRDIIQHVDRYLAAITAQPDDLMGLIQDGSQRTAALKGLLAMAVQGHLTPAEADAWCARWHRPMSEPLATGIGMTLRLELPLVAKAYSDRATLRQSWWQAIERHDLDEVMHTWTMTTQTHAQAAEAVPYLQAVAAWCQAGDARLAPPTPPSSFKNITMVGELVGRLHETCQGLLLLGSKQELLSAATRLVARVRAGVTAPSDPASCRALLPDLPWQHAATGLALTYDLAPPACIRLRWTSVPGVTLAWATVDLADVAPCPSGDPTQPYHITRSSICLDLAAEPRVRLRDPILDPGRGARMPASQP